MNAITIQKQANGHYFVTNHNCHPFVVEDARELVSIMEAQLSRLEPDMALSESGATTIPQRLENQARMIQEIAEPLRCAPITSEINNAISAIHRKLREAISERNGLNKLFDGVAVVRDAKRGIVALKADNGLSVSIESGVDVSVTTPSSMPVKMRCDVGRDAKTPVEWVFCGTHFWQDLESVTPSPMDELLMKARLTWTETMAQREQILKAFVAKHGCQPDEAEQVEEPAWPGSYLRKWSVRKKARLAGKADITSAPLCRIGELARFIKSIADEKDIGEGGGMPAGSTAIISVRRHAAEILRHLRELPFETKLAAMEAEAHHMVG